MARRQRRKFSDEYKAEVVALVRSSGKGIKAICRDLDLTETTVREWVKRADIDGGNRNGLTTAEREELSRLRRQVRVLEEERTILKEAAAGSTLRRNTRRKLSRWSHEAQRLARASVQLARDRIEIALAVPAQVRLARQVLT